MEDPSAVVPPVFRKWIRDNLERQEKAYYKDTTPYSSDGRKFTDNFEPEKYIKDADDLENCEKLLKDYFDCLQAFYLRCLAKSTKYPEIDQRTCQEAVTEWLQEYNLHAEENFTLTK